MAVIDNGLKPQIGAVCDDKVNLLTRFEVVWRLVINELFYFGRSGDSAISIIQIDVHQIRSVHLHWPVLLAERCQQVFIQTPVHKSTVICVRDHFQVSEFPNLYLGGLRRDDESGFRILIKENG